MLKLRGHVLWSAALLFVALWQGKAAAQVITTPTASSISDSVPDPEKVHMRLGPVWVKPAVNLTQFGVDTNIFNKSEADKPEKDFSIAVAPIANLWLPVGPTWFSGIVREDLIWFQKFESERSASTSTALGWTVPLSRMTISTGGTWLRTSDRPGFEIDARVARTEHRFSAGAEYRALSRTFLGGRADRLSVDYADGAEFEGQNLNEQLQRVETTAAFTVRHELTPLTSLTIDATWEMDRFELSPERDADSTNVSVGFLFSPDALFSGAAKIGYRNFNPVAGDLPGYTGSTMSANLSYAATTSTKLTVQAIRDVEFSFDANQPYYVLTGFSASVLQRLFGPFDVEGRFGRNRLPYTSRDGTDPALFERVDHTHDYGGGVGFRVGEDLRLGFNIQHQGRVSEVPDRAYSGLRFGVTATYGM